MKLVRDYDDYLLDLIIEAVGTKEAPLLFSERFRSLISRLEHPISRKLLNTESRDGFKMTYVDLDDEDLDKVSFIVTTKAVEVIADHRGRSKDTVSISNDYFRTANRDYSLRDKLYSKFRSVTSIGKLINKLFPNEFVPGGKPGEDIQSFVDKFKSARDTKDLELVKGADIVKWYNGKKYFGSGGSLGGSCMRYEECEEYIQFYADNRNVVSMLILKVKDDRGRNRIKGRALVWK
jgi:hypothetical protein